MHALTFDATRWQEMLVNGAAQMNLAITPEQAFKFACHARLVLAWNRKVNLTAITDPVQMAVKHFLDSVAPLKYIPQRGRVLDMGTGGGFPGIPLKIMRPHQAMTLIDGTRKKIHFIKHVLRELSLEKADAQHIRAEELSRQEAHVGRYATVVSRAMADIKGVVQLAQPLLAPGGKIVLYKGPNEPIPKALSLMQPQQSSHHQVSFQITAFAYRLPMVGDQRRAVIIEPISND